MKNNTLVTFAKETRVEWRNFTRELGEAMQDIIFNLRARCAEIEERDRARTAEINAAVRRYQRTALLFLVQSIFAVLISYWFGMKILNYYGMNVPFETMDDLRMITHHPSMSVVERYFVVLWQGIIMLDKWIMGISAEIFEPVKTWLMN